jgi:hypothetical protein
MKRTDLSIWLSKSVFEQLQLSHKKSVQTVDEVIITDQAMNNDNEDASDDGMNIDNEWSVLDTVGYVIMLICLLLSVVLCASVFIPRNKAGRDEFNTRFLSQNKKYSYKYISRGTEKSFGETI